MRVLQKSSFQISMLKTIEHYGQYGSFTAGG